MNNILSQSNILYTSIFLLFLTYIGYKYYKNNGEEISIDENPSKKEGFLILRGCRNDRI